MKQEKKVTLTVLLFIALVTQAIIIPFAIAEAQVDTTTNPYAVREGFQRKSFYAEGGFWAFYSDGTNGGWEFSADGVTWDGAFTSIGACSSGNILSVWFDDTYIHYIRTSTYDTFYRRGIPENDGSITWSAPEQLVYDGVSGNCLRGGFSVAVDTNGYAWIGARHDQPDGDDFPVMLKNNNNDGTWSEDFYYELNTTIDDGSWEVSVLPLTDGKMYVIYSASSASPLGRLYNGGWGAEESDLADYVIEDGYAFSAVAIGDDVHFVYNRDVTNQFRYNNRTFGIGWMGSDVLVRDSTTTFSAPALSSDPSTGDLYCFWIEDDDHVYYKQYTGGVWPVGAVDWIDESVDEIGAEDRLSSFYMKYDNYIGLLYLTKLASPYNVKFDFLTLAASANPDQPTLLTPLNNTLVGINYPFNSTWTFNDTEDGSVQTAYSLTVANNSGFTSPFLNTGKLVNSNTWHNYTGPDVLGIYYWGVTVWDSGDNSNTSKIGRYYVGPLIELRARNCTSPLVGALINMTQLGVNVFSGVTNATGGASSLVYYNLNTTLTIEQTGYGSVNMSFIASHEDYMVFILSPIGESGGNTWGFFIILAVIIGVSAYSKRK